LLYERSSQAEFLRPTVITLVYGLGFGMLLVLFLVPAVLAVQADLGRQFRALRRGLGAQAAPRARGLLWGAGVVIALWFSATLGWFIATGAALGPLPNAGIGAAFGLFLGGTVVVLIAVYALGIMVLRAGPSGRSG